MRDYVIKIKHVADIYLGPFSRIISKHGHSYRNSLMAYLTKTRWNSIIVKINLYPVRSGPEQYKKRQTFLFNCTRKAQRQPLPNALSNPSGPSAWRASDAASRPTARLASSVNALAIQQRNRYKTTHQSSIIQWSSRKTLPSQSKCKIRAVTCSVDK